MYDVIFTPQEEIRIEIKPDDPGYNYLKNDVRHKNKNGGKVIISLEKDQTYKLVNRKGMLLVWDKFSRAVAELSQKQVDNLMTEKISKEIIHAKTYLATQDHSFTITNDRQSHKDSFMEGLAYNLIDHNGDGDYYYEFKTQTVFYSHFINKLLQDGVLTPLN